MATHFDHPLSLSLTFSLFVLISSLSEPEILLSFKSSIEDPDHSLSSWSNTSSSSSHYCNWLGVTCSTTSATKASVSVISVTLQGLNLSGDISPSICKLPSLSNLNLADNLFNQPIPLHLSQCRSLVNLNLSNNLIWGPIPDQISQFGSLRLLDLSKNHVEGKIPDGIGHLKRLQVLSLGSNLLSGNIPLVFGNFSELVNLDLSENPFLVSEIPSAIGGLEKLEQLFLQRSGFYGEIPKTFVGLKGLRILDFSGNNLTGEIPPTLGASLENLVSFDVSGNKLSGSYPDGICDGKRRMTNSLGFHTNQFTGSIANKSISKCSNLERFQVQNNEFSGDFPTGLWSLPNIKVIRAENNKFSGQIHDSISSAAQLEQVQIDNNRFTGGIPRGLGMVKSLYRFSASSNALQGQLPPNFCDSPVMSIVNLSHNSLTGEIPQVRNCEKLVSLSLADNSFVGKIPPSLGELPVLTYLDLSDNNLTGSIPQELQNLKLALFNVSFNRLSGMVPSSLISGLPASYLQGNPDLCGPGLPTSCSDGAQEHQRGGLTKLAFALTALAIAILLMISTYGLLVFYRRSKQMPEFGRCFSVFFYPLRISDHDLMMAMDEKTAVGAGGTFGRVHVISLPTSELIAVKRIPNPGSQSIKALKAEIKTLAKIRHKNITKILGYCCTDDSILLIYEYWPKGSLGDLIGRPNLQMLWSVRLKVAIGVAQGLAYLHKDYTPHLLHRNIKSRNILLDADFEPKLTDFALDHLVGDSVFQSSLAYGSQPSCYIAPESSYSKRATEEMDTYSFGVVLLELLTGRQAEPTSIIMGEDSEEESVDIVKWVRRKINISNGSHQVLDPRILNSSGEEMLRTLEIALHCTSVMPEKRPTMAEVVRALQSLASSNPRLLNEVQLASV